MYGWLWIDQSTSDWALAVTNYTLLILWKHKLGIYLSVCLFHSTYCLRLLVTWGFYPLPPQARIFIQSISVRLTERDKVVGPAMWNWRPIDLRHLPPKRCLFSFPPPPSQDCSFPLGPGREHFWVGILKGCYIYFDWLIDWKRERDWMDFVMIEFHSVPFKNILLQPRP